jgi:hypothetical protein
LRRWLYAVGRYSPVLLVFAITLFLPNYLPYFTPLRDASPESAESLGRMFGGLLEVPSSSSVDWWGSMRVYFWSGVSAADLAAAFALVTSMALRVRMRQV